MARSFLATSTLPIEAPFVNPRMNHTLTPAWQDWFGQLPDTLASIPNIINTISLSTQEASIPATNLAGSVLAAGVYRVSVYCRVTRAATTSSSIEVIFSWTDEAVVQSESAMTLTANTTTTVESASLLVAVDAGTAVTYATTYASVGATSMQYKLAFSLEKIKVTL